MHTYLTPKAKIQPSPLRGKGVFVARSIKKGEIVSIFDGRLVDRRQQEKLSKRDPVFFKNHSVKAAPGFYLTPLSARDLDEDDFFNHSCSPNAGIRGQIVLVAMRNIKPGEEITYDYAMTDDDAKDRLECRCLSKNCRWVIRGSDWRKPELQKRYRGYFAWHIQEKIEGLKKKRKIHVNSR